MIVLDASAVLALLEDEPGAKLVQSVLADAVISAANLAEVLAKVSDRGDQAGTVAQLLVDAGVVTQPVTEQDAVISAQLRQIPGGHVLSLGDRLCLTLAKRLDLSVLTADTVWKRLPSDLRIELIR